MDKVAYLLISYNQAEYIVSALNSAFRQTFPNLLIVICDDGSTDGTRELITQFLETNHTKHRIKTIFNEKNIGFTAFLNSIHEQITAKYFIYSSGDDIASIYKAETSVRLLEKTEMSAVVCNVTCIDKAGSTIHKSFINLPKSPCEHCNQLNLPYHLIALTDEFIERVFPIPTGTYAEDQLLMRIAFLCKKFGVASTSKSLVMYRLTNESVTGRLKMPSLNRFRDSLSFSLETNENILRALMFFDDSELVPCKKKVSQMLELENFAILNCEKRFITRVNAVLFLTSRASLLGLKIYLKLASLLFFTPRFYHRLSQLKVRILRRKT